MKRAAVAIVLVVLLVGCGATRSDGGSGSNTNWLGECTSDSDCPSGGECWCNTCSEPCTKASDCRDSSCARAVEYGCGERGKSPELCLVECASNADCARRGNDLICVNGACLAGSAPAAGGSAGSGGASTEGGSGGGGEPANEPSEPQSGAGGEGANAGDGGGDAGSGGSGGGEMPPAGPPLDESALRPLSLAPQFGCLIQEQRVYCWGENRSGQLGIVPTSGETRARVEVAGLERARSVAVSQQHACALTTDGDVYCWGLNDQGQLGESSAALEDCSEGSALACRATPARVEGVSRAVEVAVIDARSCARLESGAVRCWGQVGGAISGWAAGVEDATSIALGPAGACATVADGSLTCSFDIPPYARDWRGLRRVALRAQTDGAPTWEFGCALGMLDEVLCFGDDDMGQLGVGEADPGSAAVSDGVSSVSLGSTHACALSPNGAVRCWGRNHGGALGVPPYTVTNCGAENCARTPIAVEGLPEAVALASESERSCALSTDGSLWCWGTEYDGGGPTREPGPWEAGGERCSDLLSMVTARRSSKILQFVSSCDVAEDCEELPLDLPCDHTCATIPITRGGESNSRQWAGVEAACQGETASCASPTLSCPPSNRRVVCRNGSCDRYDPVRSACEDPCVCDVQRFPNPAFRDECEGFDLQIFYVGNCSSCDRVGLHVALTNRGSETFSGDVTFSFDGTEPLPVPLTTSVTVAPGEVSAPLVFRTDGVGGGKEITLRVTASGDCNPTNDATWRGTVPNTSAVCGAE